MSRWGWRGLLAMCSLTPLAAHADTDACTLISSAQVGAAIHVAVGPGTHVMASFVRTCTWTPAAPSSVRAVTVNLQTAAFYDGARQTAARMGVKTKAASVGEDGYYDVAGGMAALFFKKGGAAIKVAVYAKMPLDQLEAMELVIAEQVAAKLSEVHP